MPFYNNYRATIINNLYDIKYVKKGFSYFSYYKDTNENNSEIIGDKFNINNINSYIRRHVICSGIYNNY